VLTYIQLTRTETVGSACSPVWIRVRSLCPRKQKLLLYSQQLYFGKILTRRDRYFTNDRDLCTNDSQVSFYIYIYICLYSPLLDRGSFSVSWSFTRSVGPLGRGISPSQSRCLHKQDNKTKNKCKLTSMLQVGFEPTIPVSERTKTVHALNCAATLIGRRFLLEEY
jgi:hypothetical protein